MQAALVAVIDDRGDREAEQDRAHERPPDAESTPLHKISPTLRRLKPALRKQEVLQVSNRLSSLGKNLMPIPKGIDPYKVRAQRSR